MDRGQEQSGEMRKRQSSPSQSSSILHQRRIHLGHLLSRHVALIDEIQRSAKELTSGQDEYIASQIHQLRQAANEVHRAAAPEPVTGSGGRSGPWSAEHPGSHSPRSSNDEALFHHTAQRDGISKPVLTPQLHHPMLPQASSGCLPESVPRLNSCMSCDELLSMLDSVTNPGAVRAELLNQPHPDISNGDRNNNTTTNKDSGSPISRPRKRAVRDVSSDGTDAPTPLPPPALRNHSSSKKTMNMAATEATPILQQQQPLYRTATAPSAVQLQHQQQQHMQQTLSAPPPASLPPALPRGHGSMPHLVAPHQTEYLAQSPFTTMAPPHPTPQLPPPQQQQQMVPQVYHHHHHHPAPHHAPQQQQQQQHYSSTGMMSGPLPPPHSHPLPPHNAHHHLQQQQQQQYHSAPLPMRPSAPVGLSYPPLPPRQMVNGPPLQPPMRQMSPTPYAMMGMSIPHGSMASMTSYMPPLPPHHPHHRMNMGGGPLPLPPLPHGQYMGPGSNPYLSSLAAAKMAMMGPPPRRGPIGLTGVAPPPQLGLPPHYMATTRPGMPMAPSPPPTMMSMHAAAAALAAAPVAVNALSNIPGSNGVGVRRVVGAFNTNTIPVPASLPPVRVAPPPASAPIAVAGAAAVAAKTAAKNTNNKNINESLQGFGDSLSLPPMPSAQLLADLPSLSPCALLSPPGGLGDPSTISSLALPRDTTTPAAGDPFQDINQIHLSPEEFDAVLAAFDTPGLEDAQT